MKKFITLMLILFFIKNYAAKVDTLEINSITMGKSYKAAVALPDSYSKRKLNYPVLYLLHGAYGHFDDWLKKTPNKNTVKALADQYNVIIVMPEGETFSFYLDSPINKQSQFETYLTTEVIQKIDKSYRTINDEKGRFITGLSMGGHGAMFLSTRHPELFAAAGSMSGALDMASMRNAESAEQVNKLFESVYGPQGPTDEQLKSNSVLLMVDLMKKNQLPLLIDIGVDDFLIESNRELHRRLLSAKVPHDYTERPGLHTWEYWENALPNHLLFFSKLAK